MKIVQKTLKIEKFSDVQKTFRVGPKKSRVGRVSGNKTFFLALSEVNSVLFSLT